MNPKQQRITIAEACGWKPDDDGDGTGWKGSWIRQRLIGKKPTFKDGKVISYLIEQNVPDYLNDLNAMHEAETTLNYKQGEQFEDELCDICDMENRHKEYPLPFRFAVVHATTQQRAEAFLRTLNLWKQ